MEPERIIICSEIPAAPLSFSAHCFDFIAHDFTVLIRSHCSQNVVFVHSRQLYYSEETSETSL